MQSQKCRIRDGLYPHLRNEVNQKYGESSRNV